MNLAIEVLQDLDREVPKHKIRKLAADLVMYDGYVEGQKIKIKDLEMKNRFLMSQDNKSQMYEHLLNVIKNDLSNEIKDIKNDKANVSKESMTMYLQCLLNRIGEYYE